MNIDQFFLLFLGIIFSLAMMVAMYGPPTRRKRRKNTRNNFHYNWSRK